MSPPRAGTVALGGFIAMLVAAVVVCLLVGSSYYLLGVDARAIHLLDPLLRPGGSMGVALGVLGTALMGIMHLYTLRKVFIGVAWLGPIDQWLRFHIVCGVMGPVFILLHGGVRLPKGMIAVGFWCMVLVALSGAFGRYVFGFLPRLSSGRALAWDDALAELAGLRAELVTATASSHSDAVGRAVAEVQDFTFQADGLRDLARLQREVRRRRHRIDELLDEAALPVASHRQARSVLRSQLLLKRGLESSRVAHRLLRYWHLFHRPLAKAMYVIVGLHIVVAVLFGGAVETLSSLSTLF